MHISRIIILLFQAEQRNLLETILCFIIFFNIDTRMYYSNNVVFFDYYSCIWNRYFFIICRINYAVNEKTSDGSLRARFREAKTDVYFIDATWPPWKRAHSSVFAEVAVSREQEEKSNAPLSSSRGLPSSCCLINDGVAPGSRSS